jgi:hypothetical protein
MNMKTKLTKGEKYKLVKAPEGLKPFIGTMAVVSKVFHEKNHRAYELIAHGSMVIGFSAAELRKKTFILEKVAAEVAVPNQRSSCRKSFKGWNS